MGSVASSYRVADCLVVNELCIPIFVCVCMCVLSLKEALLVHKRP